MKMQDNEEEIKKTWMKIERDSKKAGYRDGISDGRESNFQSGFDEGYREGFQNAFKIGKYKGSMSAYGKIEQVHIPVEDLLTRSSKAFCVICDNEQLLDESIPDIIAAQNDVCTKNLNELQQKYPTFVKNK